MTEKSFMTVEEVAAELRVSSLPDCKGTEYRVTKAGLSDRDRTCERYIFS